MAALLAQDATLEDALNSMREVALSACETADRVELLEQACRTTDPVFIGRSDQPITHPLFVEVRSQATLLSRLIVSFAPADPRTGKRPQHRSLRGVELQEAPRPDSATMHTKRRRARPHRLGGRGWTRDDRERPVDVPPLQSPQE